MSNFLKSCVLLLMLLLTTTVFSSGLNLIPRPGSLVTKSGSFFLSATTSITYNDDKAARSASFLNDFFRSAYGINLTVKKSKKAVNNIHFLYDSSFGKEEYTLTIEASKVVIRAGEGGLFYGLQTLMQLLPPNTDEALRFPCLEIKDSPRFAHRGALLDVGRYFFTVDQVKRFLDLMASYKLNVFHWHLTEDAGWRIEIKKYPLLTQIGAWRRGTLQNHSHESFDRLPHGGFYTREEAREIVLYAAERNITVVPEIDMPGHTMTILAAYPELSCTGGPFTILETWGIQKDVLCAGNEKTYAVVEDILEEILAIFPSEIIHIGGDEAPKDRWKACPKCQAKISEQGLKDEHELQSYFIKRVGKYLSDNGRRMLGWDEIMEGGIAENAMIMSWRGTRGGIEAARMNHDVVMTPNDFLYLDYYQGKWEEEPHNIAGFLPLERVYSYEPVPGELNEQERKHIIGLQGNIWMEFIHSVEKLNYMAFPRLLAVAEIGWSGPEKNYYDFRKRLAGNLLWLEKKNINFRIPEPYGFRDAAFESDKAVITLEAPVEGAAVYYTLNDEDPLLKGVLYTQPIEINVSGGSVKMKCIVRTPKGRISNVYTAHFSKK